MRDELLDLDVRLLVLRYGRQRVLEALAQLGEQSLMQLDAQLRTLQEQSKMARSQGSKKKTLAEAVATACGERPEITEALRTIALGFENRTLLPNLRDVARFLDRIGAPTGTLKSRVVAGPILIRALAKLPRQDLEKIVAMEASGHVSDYSLLSQAIMRSSSSRP